MAVSPGSGTFEEKLHHVPLAHLKEQVASVDVHHTRRLPCLDVSCKETKKKDVALVGGYGRSDRFDQRRLGVHRVGSAGNTSGESGVSNKCDWIIVLW